jgi:hypothetical protein
MVPDVEVGKVNDPIPVLVVVESSTLSGPSLVFNVTA